jgi:hypothetical protein
VALPNDDPAARRGVSVLNFDAVHHESLGLGERVGHNDPVAVQSHSRLRRRRRLVERENRVAVVFSLDPAAWRHDVAEVGDHTVVGVIDGGGPADHGARRLREDAQVRGDKHAPLDVLGREWVS